MRQLTTLLFIFLAGGLSLALFWVKYQVQDLEADLGRLNRAIVAERQAIHVLEAEWSLLNDPTRLQDLAEVHLELGPIGATQIAAIEDLPLAEPANDDDAAEAGPADRGEGSAQ